MKHSQIKAIVDSVGKQYFPDNYEELFVSEITSDITGSNTPRYSLKVKKKHFLTEPAELTKKKLKVRISTDNAQLGEKCKEIGINGRFIFDKFVKQKLFFRKVYLTKSKGKGYSEANKIIVEGFDCPKTYGWFIDEPHFGTVLNFHDLPSEQIEAKIRKFVSAYFEWVSGSEIALKCEVE